MTAPLTVHDVAVHLGESEETVRILARCGDLRGWKSGRAGKTSAWRFRESAVEEFITRREAAARRASVA